MQAYTSSLVICEFKGFWFNSDWYVADCSTLKAPCQMILCYGSHQQSRKRWWPWHEGYEGRPTPSKTSPRSVIQNQEMRPRHNPLLPIYGCWKQVTSKKVDSKHFNQPSSTSWLSTGLEVVQVASQAFPVTRDQSLFDYDCTIGNGTNILPALFPRSEPDLPKQSPRRNATLHWKHQKLPVPGRSARGLPVSSQTVQGCT